MARIDRYVARAAWGSYAGALIGLVRVVLGGRRECKQGCADQNGGPAEHILQQMQVNTALVQRFSAVQHPGGDPQERPAAEELPEGGLEEGLGQERVLAGLADPRRQAPLAGVAALQDQDRQIVREPGVAGVAFHGPQNPEADVGRRRERPHAAYCLLNAPSGRTLRTSG